MLLFWVDLFSEFFDGVEVDSNVPRRRGTRFGWLARKVVPKSNQVGSIKRLNKGERIDSSEEEGGLELSGGKKKRNPRNRRKRVQNLGRSDGAHGEQVLCHHLPFRLSFSSGVKPLTEFNESKV